jgi:hypothetical protein
MSLRSPIYELVEAGDSPARVRLTLGSVGGSTARDVEDGTSAERAPSGRVTQLTMTHMSEIGARTLGGLSGDATEIFQEGLLLPPVKLKNRGQDVADIWKIVLSNHRTPRTTCGDFRAMMASLDLAERRLHKLIGDYGLDLFRRSTQELLTIAETRMRSEIARIPLYDLRGANAVSTEAAGLYDLLARARPPCYREPLGGPGRAPRDGQPRSHGRRDAVAPRQLRREGLQHCRRGVVAKGHGGRGRPRSAAGSRSRGGPARLATAAGRPPPPARRTRPCRRPVVATPVPSQPSSRHSRRQIHPDRAQPGGGGADELDQARTGDPGG